MLRSSLLLLALLAAVPFLVALTTSAPEEPDVVGIGFQAPPCGNPIKQEPVLVWDVTGSTLTGPLHSRLSVYNSGLATYSEVSGFDNPGRAVTTFVAPSLVQDLRRQLVQAGGAVLCDQDLSVADIPLTTVTLFLGNTQARARTFSYWVGTGPYGDIGNVVGEFIATHIPAANG